MLLNVLRTADRTGLIKGVTNSVDGTSILPNDNGLGGGKKQEEDNRKCYRIATHYQVERKTPENYCFLGSDADVDGSGGRDV